MQRGAQIPLALWLPAAILLHGLFGGGATQVARVQSERESILAFARSVRRDISDSLRVTVEIEGFDTPEAEPEPKPDDTPAADPEEDPPEAEDPPKSALPPPAPLPPIARKPDPKAPEKPKPKQPKKPPPKPVAKAPPPKPAPTAKPPDAKKTPDKPKVAKVQPPKPKPAAKPPQRIELPKPDGRIAVINDPSLKKNQDDNPTAKRIADNANKVDEETMARFRSYDQNSSKPTGGGKPNDVDSPEPGNSHEDRRGFSVANDDPGPPRPGSENGPTKQPSVAIARSLQGSNQPLGGRAAVPGQRAIEAKAEGKGPVQPGTVSSDGGSWSISPDGGDGRKAQQRRAGRRAVAGMAGIPGVPIPGRLPGKYSVNAYGLQEALGSKQLRQEQQRARNTRLSRHRGKFKGADFSKYRAAIENYDPTVKPGNQTSLNAAKVPFAAFINRMHNRIHPIFADGFLGSLNRVGTPEMNNRKLFAHIEMVLDGQTGKLVKAGIVKTSGITAFDAGALASLHSAAPFGQAPEVIVSPDGNVYVHWEFYRDPYFACTSKFAQPYLIKGVKKPAKDGEQPRPPAGGGERERVGRRGPIRPER